MENEQNRHSPRLGSSSKLGIVMSLNACQWQVKVKGNRDPLCSYRYQTVAWSNDWQMFCKAQVPWGHTLATP